MEKIGINELLLTPLKEDYKTEQNQNNRLGIGIDIIEASIKFITILNLSVLKEIDFDEYMKISKSLQDLTLGKYYYTLWSIKVNFRTQQRFFNEIQAILSDPIDVVLDFPDTILESQPKSIRIDAFLTDDKKLSTQTTNILLYAVAFRNIFRGHSATIREEDSELFKKIFQNLDILLHEIEKITNAIFLIDGLDFYIENYDDRYKKIFAKEGDRAYLLSPMLVYSRCNQYDCKERPKLYFINKLNNSEAKYLDYISNHPFTLKTKENEWEIGTLQKSSKRLNEEINYSNREKYKELTTVFIGRKNELKGLQKHILENYHHNTLSIITGKAGIGKSAFVTQLQASIDEVHEGSISYLFYAIKNQNSDNELKKFSESVKRYLEKNIVIAKKDRSKTKITELFELVEKSVPKKSFLLIIDGLDEFDNVVKFLHDINLHEIKQSNSIHIVLSSRPYQNVLRTFKEILPTLKNFKIYNQEQSEKKGYSLELGSLSESETKALVLEMLPKEIVRNSREHHQLIDTIIKKSESLPIYIYYISRMLEEKELGKQKNYLQELEIWVEKLPPKLENYYIKTFTEIPTLSRKILIAIYFSNYGASLNELYHLFKRDDIDKITFTNEYFSEIEMFLKEHENDYYLFYHLSAKDAIFQYYVSNQKDISVFETDHYIEDLIPPQKNQLIEPKRFFKDSNYYEKLDHLFSYIFTIDSDCDFNETLEQMIETIKAKQDSEHLKRFINKSFFHIYYNYILSSIIGLNTSTKSEKNIALTHKIKENVLDFLKIFEKIGDKENTEIIAYAYKLSRLIGEHQKTMRYYEMYSRANLQTFIRICSDINRAGHIEEFKTKFDNWENDLTKEQKDILVEILILNFEVDEGFSEVFELLEEYQGRLGEGLGFD